MPTICRRPIREREISYKKEDKSSEFYNSKAWSRLRNTYISLRPLCECCLKFNKVTPAVDVHHKKRFLSGKTEEERWELFLKESNLISLCSDCHHKIHNKMNKYGLDYCDSLTEREYLENKVLY